MKRNLFKLMTLVALVVLANTAFAADGDNKNPYQGGTYSYTVSGIQLTTAPGEATISFVGFDTPPTVSDTSLTWDTDHYIVPTTASTDFTFSLTYGASEPAGIDTVIVTITEGGGSGCSNYIALAVTIVEAPSMDIAISTADGGCQAPNSTIPVTGLADAYTGGSNTASFSVETANAPAGLESFSYTVGFSGTTFESTDAGTYTADGSYDATFLSAEGGPITVTGSITGTPTFTLDAAHGGGTYNINVTASSDDAVYGALPTIGTFE